MPDLSLRVLVAERSVDVRIPSESTVATLRRDIRLHPLVREAVVGKSLKLIAAGRLLSDDNATLQSLNINDGAFIHVALTDRPPDVAVQISDGDPVQQTAVADSASAQDRMGFDRLAILGLDTEDIAVLRSQFLPEVQRDFGSLPIQPGETEAHRLLRMEDEWLRAQDDSSDFTQNLRPLLEARRNRLMWAPWMGTPAGIATMRDPSAWPSDTHSVPGMTPAVGQGNLTSFLMGMLAGMWSGPFMLVAIFFVFSPQLSPRFKLGLATGLMFNFVYLLATEQLTTEADSGSDGKSGSGGSGSGSGGDSGNNSPWNPANGPLPGPLLPVDLDSLAGR